MPKAPRKNFGTKARGWVFTINNYTDADVSTVKNVECRALVAGREVGESGTKHIQGVVFFDKQVRINHLKRVIGERGHYEAMRGTWEEAAKYCRKDGDMIRDEGQAPKQGKRNDIAEFRDAIRSGLSRDGALTDFPGLMARFPKFYDTVRDAQLEDQKRTWMTKGIWIWGPTGVGKSRKARQLCKSDPYVWKSMDAKWWDRYQGQEYVIMDDFRGEVQYSHLLQLIDQYEMDVPRRCRDPAPFLAKTVIITSSGPPEVIYPRQNEKHDSIAQLLRRVEVIHMEEREEEEDAAADASA